MTKTILTILMLLVSFPVLAGRNDRGAANLPVFTDGDLEDYKSPDDQTELSPDKPLKNDTGSADPGADEDARVYVVPYSAYEGSSLRIIIPVTLNGKVTARMALDTGSPGMLISNELADRLGLLDKDTARLSTFTTGIGGSVPSFFTVVDTVQVGEVKDHFVPTSITPALSEAFDGLIGMDFVANYSITIDTTRQVVIFEELSSRPKMPAGHSMQWWRNNFFRFASLRSEWKQYRDKLIRQKDELKNYDELKEFADKQYKEADRLFNMLNKHAIEHAVPMSWRQY
ncbi:MAG: retropepsin-like aspartic protease [Nitrospirota bacterium]|nr:retropepsin-like aspartic protease [Nitrospirota bacterium]